MRVGRLILVVATIVTIMVFPLLMHAALEALQLPSAYAAPGVLNPEGRVYQNGNNGDDDDGGDDDDTDNNDESDNEGEDNENEDVECFLSLNDNEPVPCDFEDNDNDVPAAPAAPAAAAAPPAPSGDPGASANRCYSAGETGAVFLDAPQYDVTVTVVNALGSGTRLSLRALDPATVPGAPSGSTLLDAAVWQIEAMSGCDGSGITQLPGAVNLGFAYSVSANKARLQIVRLEAGAWVEVPTVPDPDPNKPYISATIQNAGTYAVIQKP
jgi:hypothetical protein